MAKGGSELGDLYSHFQSKPLYDSVILWILKQDTEGEKLFSKNVRNHRFIDIICLFSYVYIGNHEKEIQVFQIYIIHVHAFYKGKENN